MVGQSFDIHIQNLTVVDQDNAGGLPVMARMCHCGQQSRMMDGIVRWKKAGPCGNRTCFWQWPGDVDLCLATYPTVADRIHDEAKHMGIPLEVIHSFLQSTSSQGARLET